MKKILLAGTALITVVSGSALAADMRPARAPVYTKAPMMAPAFSWTGCYVGGNGGGFWARREWSDPVFGRGGFGDETASGGLGGVQVGCNYQIGQWVLGVQGREQGDRGHPASLVQFQLVKPGLMAERVRYRPAQFDQVDVCDASGSASQDAARNSKQPALST